jgi:hypothetical protein
MKTDKERICDLENKLDELIKLYRSHSHDLGNAHDYDDSEYPEQEAKAPPRDMNPSHEPQFKVLSTLEEDRNK